MTMHDIVLSLTLTPFYLKKVSVRKWYFMVLAVLSMRFWLELGKICKNMITHICFITYHLVLRRPNDLQFKQDPRDQINFDAQKHMCVPIIRNILFLFA